jgi:hypothetical protein
MTGAVLRFRDVHLHLARTDEALEGSAFRLKRSVAALERMTHDLVRGVTILDRSKQTLEKLDIRAHDRDRVIGASATQSD